jgi:hypothetical protein
MPQPLRTICWQPLWNPDHPGEGLEHLLLSEGSADSVLLAIDEDGPFRLQYRLTWDDEWRLHTAELTVASAQGDRTLRLETDGLGRWQGDGRSLDALEGCLDIDIWPTPFTNTFPVRRVQMALGERREFRVAWVDAPSLSVEPKAQAYTRVARDRYLFESLDGDDFRTELLVDEDGIVIDYPGLFRRVPC